MKLADGYEKAFIGTTISAFGRKQVALYDYDKCIIGPHRNYIQVC